MLTKYEEEEKPTNKMGKHKIKILEGATGEITLNAENLNSIGQSSEEVSRALAELIERISTVPEVPELRWEFADTPPRINLFGYSAE